MLALVDTVQVNFRESVGELYIYIAFYLVTPAELIIDKSRGKIYSVATHNKDIYIYASAY
jgi:hypothetical protein